MSPISFGTTASTMYHIYSRGHASQRQPTWLSFVLFRIHWVYIYREYLSRPGVCIKHHPQEAPLFFGIPLSRLSTTAMTIYDFNAESNHPLSKIHLQCQIGDLKSEVTYYIIDANTSYNLLSGNPPSTNTSNMWMTRWYGVCENATVQGSEKIFYWFSILSKRMVK